jgi:ferredoxin, 2Fe-2S
MPKIRFIAHTGQEYETEAQIGQSVMQAALNGMVPGILADCGGNCSCATCHVYIDAPWSERISQPSKEERDMIECALHTRASSRLSCQIGVTAELEGLVVRLPESQT